METKFIKTVSKGSRFNQIYVPKSMESLIEVGDEVEVRLVKKLIEIHYCKGLKKLSQFKENLIKDIFSFLDKNFDFNAIFIVGSFLTEKISYNDIDIVIIADKEDENFEEDIYNITASVGCRMSEFSLLRLQYETGSFGTDSEDLSRISFQIQVSIGAHGAHKF